MSFHNHEHNHAHPHSTNTRILRVSLAVIAGFMLVEAAAFACGRCLNGAGRAAELPVQPAVEFLPPLQFPRFRPRFPAVIFACRAEKHGQAVQPLLFKSCGNGILLEFVDKRQSEMDGSSARAKRADVRIQGGQVGQYGVRGDGVAVRQGNAAVFGV